MRISTLAGGALGIAAILTGSQQNGSSRDLLQSVAWAQTAAEHRIACEQTWRAATQAMQRGIAALPIDEPLPPAVVVDVDETVLDNSPYQARLLLDDAVFDPATWDRWVQEAIAPPIPGAPAFAQACRAAGVRVFYVTNRTKAQEAATRGNLERSGFPIEPPDTIDVVLTKGEVDDAADKTARRASIAATHRVLLLVGDDLGDFVGAATTRTGRDEQVQANLARLGATWFLLPNPMYGSWERALTGAPGTAASEQKLLALDPMRRRQ